MHGPRGEQGAASALALLMKDLGLSPTEIRIYRFLVERGGAGGSAIARETSTPRGRIYEAMRELAAKGFVREEPTSPIRFVATPEIEVLSMAKARFTTHLETIKASESILSASPANGRAASAPPPARPRDVRILDGRRACNSEILRMLAQTQDWFWLSGSARFAHRLSHMPRMQEALRVASRPGTDVRLFLSDADSRTRSMQWLRMSLDALIHDVRLDATHASILTCANEASVLEILVQPNDDAPSRGDDLGIRIHNRALATATRHRLETMLLQPTPHEIEIAQLGPTPQDARRLEASSPL